MKIKHLKIKTFRNILNAETYLNSNIVCITGLNGAGKTNFLDVVYFLSNTRSYLNHIDSQNINYSYNDFFLEAEFSDNQNIDKVSCYYSTEEGKIFRINDKRYSKLAEHYGKFPSVIVTPNDINLINEGSDLRRSFVDSIISTYNLEYLGKLLEYKKILQQRNVLLKQLNEKQSKDYSVLEIYNYKLLMLNPFIHKKRTEFLTTFKSLFLDVYNRIARNNENVDIHYSSQLNDTTIDSLFEKNLEKDFLAQHTTQGIHKDDFIFSINNHLVKKNASQGQQKSFLIALKFAQAVLINLQTSKKPMMLLDDIFDKLDTRRIINIVSLFKELNLGQIFITHTDANYLHSTLDNSGFDYIYLTIDNGEIIENK